RIEAPSPILVELARVCVLCNTARLDRSEVGLRVIGDPTEAALLTLAAKLGLTREAALEAHAIEHEIPFDSDRKRMSVVARSKAEGALTAYVKGSPDLL